MSPLRFCLLLVVICWPFPLRAWDPYGHMIVTSLAYRQLHPVAKATVDQLAKEIEFPGTTYTPITIGCWMDDIRTDDPKIPFSGKFKRWHYLTWELPGPDLPPEPDPKEAEDTTDTKSGDVIRGLKRAIAVLKGGSDPSIPNRAIALALVCHLTGDIHQPLHATSHVVEDKQGKPSNDQGGNRVQITNGMRIQAKQGTQPLNLHYFWDAAYRASRDAASGEVWLDPVLNDYTKKDLEALQLLLKEFETMTPEPQESLETKPETWTKESHELARTIAYGMLPERRYFLAARIEDEYLEKAKILAKQRLVLAGFRLAHLLNEAFPPVNSGTAPIPAASPSDVP